MDISGGLERLGQRAAQYLRMSTEHQQYSIANQSAAIGLYAATHQIVIVKSFVDSGKSGLTIRSRRALQDLIRTVESGQADFDCILVYDVSRWGRFQDLDEAAHYEYLCRSAGINIHYCAEQFENGNSIFAGLLKVMKRMMAGEYSRELSVRTSAAHERLAKMGFAQGSSAVYGLRRLLVDRNRTPKLILPPKQLKALHNDRVVYVPGPFEETAIVKEIFDRCTKGEDLSEIAAALNHAGVRSPSSSSWNRHMIRRLLRNEKYMGIYTYCKTSKKMRRPLLHNQPSKWIIKKDAIPPIVSEAQFRKAQLRLDGFCRKYTNEQLLDHLRQLLSERGRLSAKIMKKYKGVPAAATYAHRFGNLKKAFALVGFEHSRDYSREADLRRQIKSIRAEWQKEIIEQLVQRGVQVSYCNDHKILKLNQDVRLGFTLLQYRCWKSEQFRSGWNFDINFKKGIDIQVFACLDASNKRVHAQYVFPESTGLQGHYWCGAVRRRVFLEACCVDTLQLLVDAVCPVRI